MKRKITGIFALCLFLTACGLTGTDDIPMEGTSAQSVTGAGERNGNTDQWVYHAENLSINTLYPGEEITGMDVTGFQDYTAHSIDYCTWKNTVYSLEGFYWQMADGWEQKYYLCCYEGDTGEIRQTPLDLSMLEGYGDWELAVNNLDIQNGQELVAFIQGWQKQEGNNTTVCYLAVHITAEGEVLSVTDLFSVLTDLGVNTETYFADIYVDAEGYYYVIPPAANLLESNQIVVLSPSGEVTDTMKADDGYALAAWAMTLPDGSPVFSWWNNDLLKIQLVTYNLAEQCSRILLEQRGLINAWLWTLTEDGYLYYVDNDDKLMRCDIGSGALEDCLYYPILGMETNRDSVKIICGDDGLPDILGHKNGETVICRLSREAKETASIQLISMTAYCEYLQEYAAEFSRENEEHPIYVQYPADSDTSAYRDRIMAELVSGNGADLYYVSAADLQILAEKGVLADLTELLSQETLSAIYPGILEMSTIDGKLAGIALEAYSRVMYVSKKLWTKDSWTLEEALEVMSAHPELEYPIMSTSSLDCHDVFQFLVMEDLAYSPFLNLEEKTCDFNHSLFIQALELAGTYREEISYARAQEIYPEKSWVALETLIPFMSVYHDQEILLGEDYYAVGFPTERESGNYWYSSFFLVVNKDTPYREEIADYLEGLLGEEHQEKLLYTVRKKDLVSRISEIQVIDETLSSGSEIIYRETTGIQYEDGTYIEILPEADGSYWVEDYQKLLESCAGRSADTSAIEDIIWEEVESYFTGSRDAAAVADIIQNRVQLYLNEQK